MSDLTPNKFAFIIENMVKEKKISYMDAILDYQSRERRFGKVSEQVSQ